MPHMRVTTISANRSVFDGRVNGRPLRLLLKFDDGNSLRLGVAGDGFRMTVDSLALDEPFHLGRYGTVVEEETQSLFCRLQNAEVKEVLALQLEDQKVGVRLMLGTGDAFHFWVSGDELFWGDEGALAAHDWLDGLAPTTGEQIHI